MRRGSILTILGIGVIAGGIAAAVALLFPWLPTPASREAGRIDFVIWYGVVIGIVIFALVVAVLAYEITHFRAKPGDDSDGPPIHGHTTLEIVWTVVPTLIVTSLAIVSAIVLSRDSALGSNVLNVDVTAQQFAWTFHYPDGNVTTATLRLPVNRSVELTLHSKDVIHSFWVPQFGQKQDTVPGMSTHLHITPDKVGTYPVICTELCGLGHALMRSEAIVMQPAAFDKWLKSQSQPASAASSGSGSSGSTSSGTTTTSSPQASSSTSASAAGKTVFEANACASCHTLKAAGATGTVGPDLDKLPAEAKGAGKPLAAFVRQSIVDPSAYVAPGYPNHVMPSTFGTSLSKSQLDALVSFLVDSSK